MPEKNTEMPSQAPREKTIFISGCDGVSCVPASEYKNYLRGFRQVCYWAAAVAVPLILALILFY